ncbi:MAG: M56 family metallopeptidase [Candidatus Moduliflexus flocculans]|nr:M56 family metallopeptidase [Candidatus Moduliflexus flocculans]
MPLTWGWRKPVVLFPAGADAWTEDERSSALFHELSHIKRADFLVMLLVRTSLALYWWNPLCWVAYRELLKEQEIACDELVLRARDQAVGLRGQPAGLPALGRVALEPVDGPARDAGPVVVPGAPGIHPQTEMIVLMEVKMKTKIMLAVSSRRWPWASSAWPVRLKERARAKP